ncbi:glycerophosphodiester phosphodiesterase family protein [Acetobacterium woodii]|uniref:Glycerophosphoryl diester phosphodiesterase GlpQ1 n=1 Tax=Acetobacterium woodii (strain ATCC 29683 / DSM 1030 / JCM 2381 / KCTC 1655 / WB1) TaxID=931626 RepID=H6LHL5_ACEWD|nr:glycerophosphodiester phosphodiesterase family protein [Acetobacterium woodii]AFA47194.1 glycerophosphoryl diester phosphodiesterase GlpQ1 [Acetobacterium woodii DSM 1030]
MIVLITIVIALGLVYLFLLAPARAIASDDQLWKNNYAHRGLHQKDKSIPENSLSAFQKAVTAGYGIELDINLTADGKVVVFHDDSLLRVCGIERLITDCTAAQLSNYRLEKTNEPIPLLEEVLQLVDGRVPIIVELKNTPNWVMLCEKSVELLDHYDGHYCIESFHPGIVRWFYKNRPGVTRGQLSAGMRSFKGTPFGQRLIITSLLTNALSRPHFVAYKHEDAYYRLALYLFKVMGGKLAGWTVRDTDNVAKCMAYFDVIIFEFLKPGIKTDEFNEELLEN